MTIAPISIPPPTYSHPVELLLLQRLAERGSELVEEYITTNTENDICFVSRDAAKRVFPEYRQARTLHNRYADAAASAIADAARRTLLSRPMRADQNRILMLTGAPASGKTKSASGLAFMDNVELQHETILTSPGRTRDLIQQALDAGREPILQLFYTDDPRINVRRMIDRARSIGRTVPLSFMARTYVRVPAMVAAAKDEFGPLLTVLVTNNSETPAEAINHNRIERALYHVNRYTEQSALEAMYGELDKIVAGPYGVPAAIFEEARRS